MAWAALTPEEVPAYPVCQALGSKLADFTPGARQYRHEASLLPIDLEEGFARAKLAVNDIDKVAPIQELAQCLPDFQVSCVVGAIAVVGFVMNGNGPVGGHTQAIDQLFEVGSVILAEASAQLNAFGVLMRIGSRKFDRSGIVVNARYVQVEMIDGTQSQTRQQAGSVSLEKPVQGPANNIVANRSRTNPVRSVELTPLANTIDGVGLNQKTFD